MNKNYVGRPLNEHGVQKIGKKLVIWLDPVDMKTLKEICTQKRMSMTDVVRYALRSYGKNLLV